MEPLVDVLIPIYNVAKCIERCLVSVLEQQYTNLHIVIVNDASPDDSMDTVKRVLASKNRINHQVEVVNNEVNRGLGAVRCIGLAHAKGKYVLFLDSDDYWDNPRIVREWVAIAEQNKSQVVIANFCHEYPYRGITKDVNVKQQEEPTKIAYQMLEGTETSYVWNKLFLRDYLLRFAHLFKPGRNLWEDLAITIPLIYHASQISYYPKVTVHYQHHSKQQYTAHIKPEQVEVMSGIISDFECDLPLASDAVLAQAFNAFVVRTVLVLTKLPFRYASLIRSIPTRVRYADIPNNVSNQVKFFLYKLVVTPSTSWLGFMLMRIARKIKARFGSLT